MSTTQIRETVIRLLGEITPEADPTRLEPDVDVRSQLDLDSMDFLNFVISVEQELGVGIPEAEYDRLRTLDEFVAYLDGRLAAPA